MRSRLFITFISSFLFINICSEFLQAAEHPSPHEKLDVAFNVKDYKKQLKRFGEAQISSRLLTTRELKKLTPRTLKEMIQSMMITTSFSKEGGSFHSGYVYKSNIILTYLARRPLHDSIPELCDIVYLKSSSEEKNRKIMYEYQMIGLEGGRREHLGNFRLYRFSTKKLTKKHSRTRSAFVSISQLEEQQELCARPPSICPVYSVPHIQYTSHNKRDNSKSFQSAPSTPRMMRKEQPSEQKELQTFSLEQDVQSLSSIESPRYTHTRDRSESYSTYTDIVHLFNQMKIEGESLERVKEKRCKSKSKRPRVSLFSSNSLSNIKRPKKSQDILPQDQLDVFQNSGDKRRARFMLKRN